MTHEFSDETLMAFADGELDDETTLAVEQAMNDDPAIAERIAVFMETGSLARTAFDRMLEKPVPDALRTNVEAMLTNEGGTTGGDTVIAFRRPVEAPKTSLRPLAANANWMTAAAASVALVIGAAVGYGLSNSSSAPPTPNPQFAEITQMPLEDALNSVASGDEAELGDAGNRFRAIASYRDGAGTLCREFEVDKAGQTTFVSVACHGDQGWELTFMVAAASQGDGSYAPASSLDVLDTYLDAVGAQATLSADDEKAALKALR